MSDKWKVVLGVALYVALVAIVAVVRMYMT
jgi:hypothetical protein